MEVDAIEHACRLIGGGIEDPTARLTVAIETGPDEAFLIGSADAYLRLALAALQLVRDAHAGRGRQVAGSNLMVAESVEFGRVFEPGEVSLTCGWLTGSSGEARTLVRDILANSPPADSDA